MTITEKAERRRVTRKHADRSVVRVELKDGMGNARWVTADLLDRSLQGIGVSLIAPLPLAAPILVIGKFGEERTDDRHRAVVTWCQENGDGVFRAGLEFPDVRLKPESGPSDHQIVPSDALDMDWYEIMQ